MSRHTPIVLITCDELRRDALGCFGGRVVDTPNIDRLAQCGTRYDNSYTVSPWCLPARCSILTGLYPHRSGAYSNFRKCPLDQGLPNLFTQLKQKGYRTSLFGKCHFAPVPYSETCADRTLPYDEFKAYYRTLGIDRLELQDDKQVSIWYYDDYSKELDAAGYLEEYRRLLWDHSYGKVFPFPGPKEWHPDAWVGDRAAQFFATPQEDDAPTFTWISFSGPHYPFDTPQEYYDRVHPDALPRRAVAEDELADEGRIQHKSFYGGGNIDGCGPAPGHACKNYTEEYWKNLQTSYYANVALIDDEVGKILAKVRECYGDDVLVIFTADHGEMLGNHGVWGKHNCGYEDVWRIPMLIQFPKQTQASVQNGIVNLTDILPTCLDIAGIQPAQCDGQSLKELDGGLRYTFGEGEGYCAVTDGRFKYIHVQKSGENYREFLDLQSDPHEFVNQMDNDKLAADRARLLEKLVEHFMPKVLP